MTLRGLAHKSVRKFLAENSWCLGMQGAVGLVWSRHSRGAVSGVVCQIRIAGCVHFPPVTRIKTLRTPNKSGLWPEVNGWLGLAQSGTWREWVPGVIYRSGLGLEFLIRNKGGESGSSTPQFRCHWLAGIQLHFLGEGVSCTAKILEMIGVLMVGGG